jgi:spermidine synthase
MVAMILLACFFLSGLSGLVYEIVWVRMIDKVVGSAPFAVAIVLTVFMGGLALGSFLAGRRIDGISEKGRLLATDGKLELGIGAYSLVLLILLARQGQREKAVSLLRQGLRFEDNPTAHQFLRELLLSQ